MEPLQHQPSLLHQQAQLFHRVPVGFVRVQLAEVPHRGQAVPAADGPPGPGHLPFQFPYHAVDVLHGLFAADIPHQGAVFGGHAVVAERVPPFGRMFAVAEFALEFGGVVAHPVRPLLQPVVEDLGLCLQLFLGRALLGHVGSVVLGVTTGLVAEVKLTLLVRHSTNT